MASKRPLKVGVMLPVDERQMAGRSARWSDLAAMATTAEAVGFDSIWVADHVLFRFRGEEANSPLEAWSILAGFAAITKRVEIGPMVSCTSFRNPAMLAKIVDTVDEMSNGRVILGLGAGWHEPEYLAYGYPFDHRVSRFEEALTIIHGLLRNGEIDFAGEYYTARECELRPRGPRKQGPPIMIGSKGERMLGLLAKYADSWNVWARNRPADIEPDLAAVDAAMIAHGRDPKTVERTCTVLVDLPGKTGRASREKSIPLSGSHEEMAEAILGFPKIGVTHIQLVFDPNTVDSIEKFAPVLDLIDRA